MSRPPIYIESGKTLRADSCLPQRQAMAEGKLIMPTLARGHYPGQPLAPHVLPGVRIVGFMHMQGAQDWAMDWHRNEGLELCLLESGRLTFLVDEQRYELQPGDLTITRPWQLHRLGDPLITAARLPFLVLDVGVRRPDQPWRWPPWVMLAERDLAELTNLLRHTHEHVWSADASLRACFQRLSRLVEGWREENHLSHLTIYLNELLLLTLELLRASKPALNRQLSGRRHTVELFLADLAGNTASLREPWTLETMAERCGLSPSSFLRYCKDLVNMTPIQYLARCRVEAAARMLAAGAARNITEVAFATGFNSSQYFATTFRQHFRCSPRQYVRLKGAGEAAVAEAEAG